MRSPERGSPRSSDGDLELVSVLNADAEWDQFEPSSYMKVNYAELGSDDRQILEIARDFFASCDVHDGRGIDAGCGANLYPALSLLPYCAEVTLFDYSRANVEWMRHEIEHPARNWDSFWELLQKEQAYAEIGDFRSLLSKTVHVEQGNVLDLAPDQYDIGTMFFVAESLTSKKWQFRQAVTRFVRSLHEGAPFAIAFMVGSKGYKVADKWFPAVEIDGHDMQQCLQGVANLVSIHDIELRDPPLREGYKGMSLATGWATGGARDGGLGNEDRATAQSAGDLARAR